MAIAPASIARAREVLRRVWGYDSFRPLQQDAVEAALAGKDSLVVLPTGGGKSLCFQVPALCLSGTAVVVSPLISLMKDQVDTLRANGVSAVCVNSSQTGEERRQTADELRNGTVKLLYVSPERLLTDRMLQFLSEIEVSLFAIDEAHCVSDWGHDFRPEYRGLRVLKERFPNTAVHAYTATAAEHVRTDISVQLGLKDPSILVGGFDRPNLTYRFLPADKRLQQIAEVVERHRGESGIIYCISRKEVEKVAGALKAAGLRAAPYHAGLDDETRRRHQEAFIRDEIEIITATVAFGMGIDKPNVRYVIHANMPKSIEHYQQESGRAGRDGLESECVLLFSRADVMTWKRILEDSSTSNLQQAMQAVNSMADLCAGGVCRHRALSRYFGQDLDSDSCEACDVCLDESPQVADPLILAQKILSCVARLEERFGADYTTKVLTGSSDARIAELGHERLSTFGLLKENTQAEVRFWLDQLVAQQYLQRSGEYQTLSLTQTGRLVLRGAETPKLGLPPTKRKAAKSSTAREQVSWEGVDRELFDVLRQTRMELAAQRQVPAYVIFGDAVLREMARVRPSSAEAFARIRGVGRQKLADFAEIFLESIDTYCSSHDVVRDVVSTESLKEPESDDTDLGVLKLSGGAAQCLPMFEAGEPFEAIAAKVNRARSTVMGYFAEFMEYAGVTDVSAWVSPEDEQAVLAAADDTWTDGRLRTLYERLGEKIPYDVIRIVLTCRKNRSL